MLALSSIECQARVVKCLTRNKIGLSVAQRYGRIIVIKKYMVTCEYFFGKIHKRTICTI